jgi:hypothetical protein
VQLRVVASTKPVIGGLKDPNTVLSTERFHLTVPTPAAASPPITGRSVANRH